MEKATKLDGMRRKTRHVALGDREGGQRAGRSFELLASRHLERAWSVGVEIDHVAGPRAPPPPALPVLWRRDIGTAASAGRVVVPYSTIATRFPLPC